MTLLGRNFLVSIILALSDFFSFVISLYLAIGLLSLIYSNYLQIESVTHIDGWIALHWLLAFVALVGILCACAIIL